MHTAVQPDATGEPTQGALPPPLLYTFSIVHGAIAQSARQSRIHAQRHTYFTQGLVAFHALLQKAHTVALDGLCFKFQTQCYNLLQNNQPRFVGSLRAKAPSGVSQKEKYANTMAVRLTSVLRTRSHAHAHAHAHAHTLWRSTAACVHAWYVFDECHTARSYVGEALLVHAERFLVTLEVGKSRRKLWTRIAALGFICATF